MLIKIKTSPACCGTSCALCVLRGWTALHGTPPKIRKPSCKCLREGFLLAHKDSNLERQNQNLLCCQLHHGPISNCFFCCGKTACGKSGAKVKRFLLFKKFLLKKVKLLPANSLTTLRTAFRRSARRKATRGIPGTTAGCCALLRQSEKS